MVDGAEDTVGHEYEGQLVRGHVIDGERVVVDGYHQSSGPFDEHAVVAGGELFRAFFYEAEVDSLTVESRCELGRGGVGEDYGCGGAVRVFREGF